MEKILHKNMIEVRPAERFSPRHTFSCGQCFRWRGDEDGVYTGIAYGKAAKIWEDNGSIFITSDEQDFDAVWCKYLDLDRDYSQYDAQFCKNDFMRSAVDFGRGLKILAQEPWEALISFIISQCNNIPRIEGIIEKLCAFWGDEIEFDGKTVRTFPSPARLAALSLDELAPLRAGYRADYILTAAKAVAAGELDFSALSAMDTATARTEIMKLRGVGRKVADCFLLFGLSKMDAFPVDTWMKKAAPFYGDGLDITSFGDVAGIAQQYIFYYARENGLAAK